MILEELAMNEDDPADVAHERFTEAILGGHPLGRPIGGTPEIIQSVTRASMLEHYREHYVPEGLIITAAGGVDHVHRTSLGRAPRGRYPAPSLFRIAPSCPSPYRTA